MGVIGVEHTDVKPLLDIIRVSWSLLAYGNEHFSNTLHFSLDFATILALKFLHSFKVNCKDEIQIHEAANDFNHFTFVIIPIMIGLGVILESSSRGSRCHR